MMSKMRLILGLLAVTSVLAIPVSPAFAEFKSHSKSSEGTKTLFAINVEGIGATINCGDLESGPKWKIEKNGTAAEVGALLLLKFKSLGTCLVAYTESEKAKEVKATSNECEWEINEPKAEALVADTTVSTCTIKPELAKACEVKIEPKENKNREKVSLADSGETNENLSIELSLSAITVTATGEGCTAAGIKSTSLATLNGAMAVQQVQPGIANPQFALSTAEATLNFNTINQKKTVRVSNVSAGPAATPTRVGVSTFATGGIFGTYWTSENMPVNTCATTAVNEGFGCNMEIKLTASAARRGFIVTSPLVYTEGGVPVARLDFFGNR
jgi:hypothetical protein